MPDTDPLTRIESALGRTLDRALAAPTPADLRDATRYAVFPPGGRLRPRLCLEVARAFGDDRPALADAAAASIELLHCASLVHDDLPCFDDSPLRRGRPSVHARWGTDVAILVGDGLVILAFQVLAWAAPVEPARLGPIVDAVARGVGCPSGLVAGQAMERAPAADVRACHEAKTAALFVAAAEAGALAAGGDPAPWRPMARLLGEAYQVADDLYDAIGETSVGGKPTSRDADRPSVVGRLGIDGAMRRLETLETRLLDAAAPLDSGGTLRPWLQSVLRRFETPCAPVAPPTREGY